MGVVRVARWGVGDAVEHTLKAEEIDYKDVHLMRRFVSERGKLVSGQRVGVSAKNQRRLARAIKRAQHLALIPTDEAQPSENAEASAVEAPAADTPAAEAQAVEDQTAETDSEE